MLKISFKFAYSKSTFVGVEFKIFFQGSPDGGTYGISFKRGPK